MFRRRAAADKISRVGFVSGTGEVNNPGPFVTAFRRGLSDLGYVEGKNIHVEYRYVQGRTDRIANFFNELAQLKVDIIVSSEAALVRAAKKANTAIPVVMVINGDPVANGYIDSLARPGGNITGLTRLNRELSGKRIELVKEVTPKISKIGILFASSRGSLANSFQRIPVRSPRTKNTATVLGSGRLEPGAGAGPSRSSQARGERRHHGTRFRT